MATQLANRTTGAVSDELIERAHRSQMLRAGLDSRHAAIVVAAGYSVPLEHHGLENEPPYPVEDDQPGAR